MTPDPFDPHFRPPRTEETAGPTDLHSLQEELAEEQPTPWETAGQASENSRFMPTDFVSLGGHRYDTVEPRPPRTWADVTIDTLTPLLIVLMVYAVIFFLLDIRYIYTEVHDGNFRFVSFCFVLGVVALNRLIARDGSEESMLYLLALAGAIGMYTFSTTGAFEVGSVARNFMNDSPALAAAFNVAVVIFIWWLVNRLTHECCVDENEVAGDIGILTGLALKWRKKAARLPQKSVEKESSGAPVTGLLYDTLRPYDPTEDYRPAESKRPVRSTPDWASRLPRRHPGSSIFFFSVPVLVVFTLGLPVVRHGGGRMVAAGLFYMGVYVTAALLLLMLTSLNGLRQYFRSRRVLMPSTVAWFWVTLGGLMVFMVLGGALELPKPALPGYAQIDMHEKDPWRRGPVSDRFQLMDFPADATTALAQSHVQRWTGRIVIGVFALLGLYTLLKALGNLLAAIGRHRDRYPRFIVACFTWLDALARRFARAPAEPPKKRRRLYKGIASSSGFRNSLGDPAKARMTPQGHIAYAYQALSALVSDMGGEREKGQTPYELLANFPKELASIREEAEELVQLYVVSAYSEEVIEERVLDRLRKFWLTFEHTRNRLMH